MTKREHCEFMANIIASKLPIVAPGSILETELRNSLVEFADEIQRIDNNG